MSLESKLFLRGLHTFKNLHILYPRPPHDAKSDDPKFYYIPQPPYLGLAKKNARSSIIVTAPP